MTNEIVKKLNLTKDQRIADMAVFVYNAGFIVKNVDLADRYGISSMQASRDRNDSDFREIVNNLDRGRSLKINSDAMKVIEAVVKRTLEIVTTGVVYPSKLTGDGNLEEYKTGMSVLMKHLENTNPNWSKTLKVDIPAMTAPADAMEQMVGEAVKKYMDVNLVDAEVIEDDGTAID